LNQLLPAPAFWANIRGGARCASQVLRRGAKTEACGHSFAQLTTQVSTVFLLLRQKISAWAVATRRGVGDTSFNNWLAPAEKNLGVGLQRRWLTCSSMLQ
jgi:hypothetical protein